MRWVTGDHAASLQLYLGAADWVEWMGGPEATAGCRRRRCASTQLLLGVREGLQRVTVRAAATAGAATSGSGAPIATSGSAHLGRRRPCWVWPVPTHRLLEQQRGMMSTASKAEQEEEEETSGATARICQRCFTEDATGCTIDLRTGERLCAVCSGDKPAGGHLQQGAEESKRQALESVLAADSEQPPHFAMLAYYGAGLTGSAEPCLINQWRQAGVCACCGRCGPLAPPRCTSRPTVAAAAPASDGNHIPVAVPPVVDRLSKEKFMRARNGLLGGAPDIGEQERSIVENENENTRIY